MRDPSPSPVRAPAVVVAALAVLAPAALTALVRAGVLPLAPFAATPHRIAQGHGWLVLTSARRGAALHRFEFTENDSLVFGRETSGLPPEVIGLSPHHVRIPIKGEVRSINLSTAAGIVLFQALVSAGLVGE